MSWIVDQRRMGAYSLKTVSVSFAEASKLASDPELVPAQRRTSLSMSPRAVHPDIAFACYSFSGKP